MSTDLSSIEAPATSSRAEALRSTSIIGASSIVVLLIRMVRTKIIAVALGPGGIGLEALFDSIITVSRTLFEGGLGAAGVRQVAAAAGDAGGVEAAAKTAFVLRRAYVVLGVVGAASVFLARGPISLLVFGRGDLAGAIGLLSITLLFTAIAGGQAVVLNGLRRIGDLALVNVWGTLAGTAVSIPIVLAWGLDGVATYMVLAAGAGLFVSSYYIRRVNLPAVRLDSRAILREISPLMRLGVAFLATSLMSTGTIFALRVLVTREVGVEAAGQFQAASALSMVYVGFILTAMGADYFPRLSAVAEDDIRCNQMVNEQTEISFLLALPGILATVALAPWVIRLFYSNQFDVASEILTWQMAGMFLRLASWPMGFILMAKGRGLTFVLADAVAWTTYISLAWLGLRTVGLPGIGMAFLGCYLVYTILILSIVRGVSGFVWSGASARLLLLGVLSITAALCMQWWLSDPWATALGIVLTLGVGVECLRTILRMEGLERLRRLPGWMLRVVPPTLRAPAR